MVAVIAYATVGLSLFVPFARWWDEPEFRRAGPVMTLFMCCLWPLILACAAVWWASKRAYEWAIGEEI